MADLSPCAPPLPWRQRIGNGGASAVPQGLEGPPDLGGGTPARALLERGPLLASGGRQYARGNRALRAQSRAPLPRVGGAARPAILAVEGRSRSSRAMSMPQQGPAARHRDPFFVDDAPRTVRVRYSSAVRTADIDLRDRFGQRVGDFAPGDQDFGRPPFTRSRLRSRRSSRPPPSWPRRRSGSRTSRARRSSRRSWDCACGGDRRRRLRSSLSPPTRAEVL